MNTTTVPDSIDSHAAGSRCVGPTPLNKSLLIRQVFEDCCQQLKPSGAGAWLQMPTGQLSLIAQAGSGGELAESMDDCLSKIATQAASDSSVPQQVYHGAHHTTWKMPIQAIGFHPVMFVLTWKHHAKKVEVPTLAEFSALSQLLAQRLHQALLQAHRTQNSQWNRWRVSPEPVATPPPSVPESLEHQVLQQVLSLKDSVSQVVSHEITGTFHSASDQRPIAGGWEQSAALIQLAEGVSRQIDLTRAAYDVVNALQAYLACGRISLFSLSGGRAKLCAISGVASFDTRSATVVAITNLVQRVSLGGQALWHPDQGDDCPEEIALALDQYYETTDARSVAVIPVIEFTEMPADPNDLASAIRSETERRGRKLAVIVIEGIRHSVRQQVVEERWRAAERIVTQAIGNAQRYSQIPMLPVWRLLGDTCDLFQGHHRKKALAITITGLILILLSALVPYPLKLKAEGNIQPKHRSRVYAEVAGVVVDLPAVGGANVSAGEPLIQLSSPELEIEYARVQGEYLETRQAAVAIRDHLNSVHALDEATLRTLRKERAGMEERLRSLRIQYELLETKRNQLCIRSPQAGQVITWDLNQRLSRRPVEPGQHLLTVADASGPWELELIVPDRLTGYLRHSMESPAELEVPVDFVLTSDPRTVYRGYLRRISESFQVDNERGPVLRVYVDLGDDAAEWLRQVKPGTEVMARIHAGRYPLGYCFFFEFFDWTKRQCFKYFG